MTEQWQDRDTSMGALHDDISVQKKKNCDFVCVSKSLSLSIRRRNVLAEMLVSVFISDSASVQVLHCVHCWKCSILILLATFCWSPDIATSSGTVLWFLSQYFGDSFVQHRHFWCRFKSSTMVFYFAQAKWNTYFSVQLSVNVFLSATFLFCIS